MQININDFVKVRLTAKAKEILLDQHNISERRLHQMYNVAYHEFIPPEEDKDGWSKWQLWDLMAKFGSHISMTSENLFVENIIDTLDEW